MKKTVLTFTLLSLSLAYSGGVRPGFDANSLAANDDSSTGLVPFGFTIDFFGLQRDSAYLNNNGNITFNSPLSTFTPSNVDLATAQIIAPFFGDVDTRGTGSNLMTYQQGTLFGHNAFYVNWVDVGYFNSRTDLLNSFQLVLIDRSDVAPGAFDIEFNYDKIQWETGEASGGD